MTPIEPPKIEQLRLDQLTPYAGNARRHPPEQIQQIADAIQRLGFLNPILVDSAGVIIAGHGRYEAAKLLALSSVPVVRLSDLTDEQARCMRIEDNALAAASRWDMSALVAEVDRLTEIADSSITGLLRSFDPAELFRDALPAEPEPSAPAPGASTGAADDDGGNDDEATADPGNHETTAGPLYEANIIAAEPELIPAPPAGACVHPPDFSGTAAASSSPLLQQHAKGGRQ